MALYVITGPPAGGKTTWVKDHAQPGDITIDFDSIAATLTPHITHYDPPQHIIDIAVQARQAAINAALLWSRNIDVYIIHAAPPARQLAQYRRFNAQIITIDPGYETCMERAHATKRPSRSIRLIKEWFSASYVKAEW